MTLQPTRENATRLFESLLFSHAYCNWCFARKRKLHEEYDEAVAQHLQGKNSAALEALGHGLEEDGGLLVNTATSTPEPNTYLEVPPPKTDERGRITASPRPKRICSCGEIDIDPTADRATGILLEAARNIADELTRQDITVSKEHMVQFIHAARKHDTLAGKDKRVLTGAIRCGLKHG